MTPRIHVRAGACLLTALGVLNSSGVWVAQGNPLVGAEPAAARSSAFPSSSPSGAVGANRSRSEILQVASKQPVQPAQQSAAVQKRLQELYDRDGREMPNMNLQQMPVQGPPAANMQNSGPANGQTAAPMQQPPRKRGFFDRLVPGFMRKSEAPQQPTVQAPPQRPQLQRPPQPYQQPQAPAMAVQPPAPFPGAFPNGQPQSQQPKGIRSTPQTATAQRPGNFRIPLNAPAEPVLREGSRAKTEDLGALLDTLESTPEAKAPEAAPVKEKSVPKLENALDAEETYFTDQEPDLGGKPKITPKGTTRERGTPIADEEGGASRSSAPGVPERAKLTRERGTPIADEEGGASRSSAPGVPERAKLNTPAAEPLPPSPTTPKLNPVEEVASPFTGLKLDAESKELGIASQANKPSTQIGMATGAPGSRVTRLSGKTEIAGLKGYCLVTLKNERKLVLTLSEHKSEYMQHTYTFASAEAKAAFDAAPASYVPTLAGRDVVRLEDGGGEAEGSLDYAVWYKGRLYMFSNEASLNTFSASPSKFVVKE